jgi:Uma2 family endonuclease
MGKVLVFTRASMGDVMTTLHRSRTKPARETRRLPPLENGDRLDQKTFHERYEAMPPRVRAELIEGTVYMTFPQKKPHGRVQNLLGRWLDEYEEATLGTEVCTNTTAIIGSNSEPQPDAWLIILPEHGGQTWEDDDYVHGAPELVAEVSWATESIDLHGKKRDYEKAGVREYLVAALRQEQVFWFVRRRGKFRELAPGADGVLRSEVFPGLWLDAAALLGRDRKRLLTVLRKGLASTEHAAFVRKLAGS